jgi:hypothetical protein
LNGVSLVLILYKHFCLDIIIISHEKFLVFFFEFQKGKEQIDNHINLTLKFLNFLKYLPNCNYQL